MRVVDAHRLLGPVPDDDVPTTDEQGVLRELDHLGIDAAMVTSTAELLTDPRDADKPGTFGSHRLEPVPVVVPGLGGAGSTADIDAVIASGPAMVRVCPVRHRFDLLGPLATRCWRELTAARIPVALAVDECGLEAVGALARAVPGMTVFAVTPGYRTLRPLVELMTTFPRVYVETGTLVAAGALEWLAGQVGARRLVFGTGAPVWDDAGPRFQLDHLRLPAADVALIAAGSLELMRAGEPG